MTTVLHPQSDGMVQRFNRTIEQHLSLFVFKHQRDRNELIPFFLLTYRTAIHETTGNTLGMSIYGRGLRLPCDLLFRRPEQPEDNVCDTEPT